MPNDTPAIWAEYDFYQLLGVPKNAPSQVIKAAIKQKLLEWHPDRQRGQSPEVYETFTRLTKAVNAANETLLDSNSRTRYNRFRGKHDQRNQSQYSNSGDGQHHQRESWSEYSRRYGEHSNSGRDRQRHRDNWSDDSRRSSGHESGHTRDTYRTRAQTQASASGSSARTLGYVILALLALAAAGGLIYGFIQALPAIIDFLGTLFTWVIALGFWIVIIALVLKSYSRN